MFHWEVGDVHYFEGYNWSSSYFHDLEKRREIVYVEHFPDSIIYVIQDCWKRTFKNPNTGESWSTDGNTQYEETYRKDDWSGLSMDVDELMTGSDYLPGFSDYGSWWFGGYVELSDYDFTTALRVDTSAKKQLLSEGYSQYQWGSFFDDQIILNSSETLDGKVCIVFSRAGQLIQECELKSGSPIPTSNWSSGIYIILVFVGSNEPRRIKRKIRVNPWF